MTVRRHEDLIAWQLGMKLARRLGELVRRDPARRDRNFCSELLESSEAISANIAEGFDRFGLKQFRYFLQIAKGSLGETTTRIRQGFARRFWTVDEFNELLLLGRRTRGAITALIVSLNGDSKGGTTKRDRLAQGRQDQ
jgi:four helix bundle protein